MIIEKIQRQPRYLVNRTRLSVHTNQTINWLVITLIVLILVLSGSYLFLKSRSAQQAYLLSQIQEDHNRLKNENEGLNAKLVEALSFQKLEETERVKDMTEAENKTFVQPPKKKKKPLLQDA